MSFPSQRAQLVSRRCLPAWHALRAPSVVVEFALRRHLGYQWALTVFEICVIFALS